MEKKSLILIMVYLLAVALWQVLSCIVDLKYYLAITGRIDHVIIISITVKKV